MPESRPYPPPPAAPRCDRLRGPWVALAVLLCAGPGCKREPPPGAETPPEATTPGKQVGTPVVPGELAAKGPAPSSAVPGAPVPPTPHTGPYLVVTDTSAGLYADTSFEKKLKIGYARSGGRIPVDAATVAKENCPRGWYRVKDGGFACGNVGTTNPSAPEARFALRKPNPDGVLPYTYVRNSKNGTPLYKSVPTAEQMREYEPYLVKKAEEPAEEPAKDAPPPGQTPKPESAPLPFSREAIEAAKAKPAASPETAPFAAGSPQGTPSLGIEQGVDAPDGGADDKPWWQRADADKRLHEVKLGELEADADDVLAKRMVKGFYVAVDRQFNWNGRSWYKTTKGLVAPADRFWVTAGSEFHGVELDGGERSLPVGFTYGWQKGRPKHQMGSDGKLTPAGSLEYHAPVFLTGKESEIGGKKYLETKDTFWVLATHLRVTNPGPPPVDLGPTERWLDINLKTQTIVVFDGTRAVYASLISSGKESKVEEKDHRTPTGEWRIREKHVTTTMDGDGSAAGDLPYSIEDVPYVMYFHRAFAVHGAFWHSNYGVQMSHGCVNLSPLDAKWIFNFTEPGLPEGWHGVWATAAHPGSRVVVHE